MGNASTILFTIIPKVESFPGSSCPWPGDPPIGKWTLESEEKALISGDKTTSQTRETFKSNIGCMC